MMTHPGKKLNFMGNELAMFREWDEKRELDWHLTETVNHADFLTYITALNRLYCQIPALWSLDHTYDGFKWVENISNNSCVFGYTRTDGQDIILTVLNFSDVDADLTLNQCQNATLLLSTHYGIHSDQTLPCSIPPYCGLLYRLSTP